MSIKEGPSACVSKMQSNPSPTRNLSPKGQIRPGRPWERKSALGPPLLPCIFARVASSPESQRDSATKPRVARNELPWENARHIGDNPERVADCNGERNEPVGVARG